MSMLLLLQAYIKDVQCLKGYYVLLQTYLVLEVLTMSRTKRDTSFKLRSEHFRAIKTMGTRLMELNAVEELQEAGFNVSSRQAARGNLGGKAIPNNRDELFIAAREEVWGS